MRSIPGAIVWEMLYRGRWWLILGAFGALLFPLLIENALSRQGGVEGSDPAQIMMHIMLVQLNMFMFGAAVMNSLGSLGRLYAAPIPTSRLVAWYLFPSMLLMFLQTAACTVVINALFPLNWPIWGPALFAAVSLAVICAALWQSDKTGWVVIFLGVVAVFLGLWFKARHGTLFGPIETLRYWSQPTFSEILTMLAIVIVSYYAAVQGVARSRRGDILPPLGIVAWIQRVFDPPPENGPPFKSAAAAQFWFIWRAKGAMMPGTVLVVVVGGLLGWLIFDRQPHDLVMGFVAGGGMLSCLGIVAAISLGNCGPSDQNFDMGNFIGTRPMTSREMSRIVIHATLRSIAIAWGIWAGAFLCVAVILLLCGVSPPAELQLNLIWYYLPATLLGPWIVASLGVPLGLTGRAWIIVALCFVGIPCGIAYIALTEMFLSRESQLLLGQWITGTVGILLVLYTLGAYLRARHRALLDAPALYLAALVWLTSSALVIAIKFREPAFPISGCLLVIGLLALAVVPFPTVPLALVWNRVR